MTNFFIILLVVEIGPILLRSKCLHFSTRKSRISWFSAHTQYLWKYFKSNSSTILQIDFWWTPNFSAANIWISYSLYQSISVLKIFFHPFLKFVINKFVMRFFTSVCMRYTTPIIHFIQILSDINSHSLLTLYSQRWINTWMYPLKLIDKVQGIRSIGVLFNCLDQLLKYSYLFFELRSSWSRTLINIDHI